MRTERLAGSAAAVVAGALLTVVGLGAAGVGAHGRALGGSSGSTGAATARARAGAASVGWVGPGPVRVAGVRSVVLAAPDRLAAARMLAAEVDRDVATVTAAWGTGWAQRAEVLLPDTTAEAASLAGEGAGFADVAAAAVDGRVVVDPTAYARLTAAGRRVVVTHELTHLATASVTTALTPDWLVEGYADTVGYTGAGLSAARITAELTTDVRAGRVPAALPVDAAFGAGSPDLAATYEQGWLACRLLGQRLGVAGLAALYRDAGRLGPDAAIERDGHETPAAFTARWRAALGALA